MDSRNYLNLTPNLPQDNRDPVRWGILSAGQIAEDFATAMKESCSNGILYAIAASQKERADKFGDKFGIKTRYGSYEELVKDPNVDIIYASPINPKHKEIVSLCLQHGKPVLCEKPFTINAGELSDLVRIAREKKIFLSEAMWTRYFPVVTKLNELIKEGTIGDILYVSGTKGIYSDKDRICTKEYGGGVLMDVGIYLVSFAHMLFRATPTKITASAKLRNEIDIQTTAILDFPTGQAVLSVINGSENYSQDYYIVGTKATVHVSPTADTPDKLTIKFLNKEGKQEGDIKVIEYPLIESKNHYNFPRSEGLGYEAQAVGEAWRAGKLETDEMPLDESIKIMETMDEIRAQIGVVFDKDKDYETSG
jgi:predicted dehydrogenase